MCPGSIRARVDSPEVIATTDYDRLTEDAALVARTDRAVLELDGAEAAEFLQGQVSNDIEGLEPGQGCYATLLDHKGKLRTDLRVLRLAPDRLVVDAESAGRRALAHTFEMYSLGRQVIPRDVTDERVVLSLIGPAAHDRLEGAPGPTEHACVEGPLGVYATTDVGVDLILAAEREAEVRDALDLTEVDEEAAEVVRIERGRPRLLLDMDSSTMPQEAGINDRAVSFTKGCYVGQETVARLFYRGKPNRHLRGLRLSEAADHGEAIMLGDKQVGTVGSSCVSPASGPIALALLRREAEPGAEVLVNGAPASVVELPFA
jgi:folate-binding protein YgfZ